MANILLITAILLHWFFHADASGTKNLGVLQSKVKDAAIATQATLSKLAMEEASNDSKSNEYLNDLMIESITINGTKVTPKPPSKSSKRPSNSPVNSPSVVTIPTQSSNAPSPFMNTTGCTTSVPTSKVTAFNSSNSSFQDDAISESSHSPSQAGNLDKCPNAFDSSVEYFEFDIVSMGSVIYECKEWPRSTYCNSFEPGSEYSDHGWTVLAPCIASPTQSPTVDGGEGMSLSPSSISPTDITPCGSQSPPAASNSSEGSSQSPSILHPTTTLDESHTPSSIVNSITVFPTSTPISQGPSSTESSPVSKNDDVLSVNLPKIICDISLSPSLVPSFEKKHILLVAMTNTIYNIFDIHLNKDLYDIVGISLAVSVNKNINQSATSMIRLKADFTGTASFSLRGAPSERDLVDILLRHFSIDEFTRRLIPPSKTRAADPIQEPVLKVNSVFFSFEDGMLVRVGAIYDPVSSSPTLTSGTLENANMQLAVGILFLTAVGFALVMVLFVAHSKRIELDDEDQTDSPDPPTDNHTITQRNAAHENRVEIAARTKNPFFGGLETISDVSSLSESPYTDRSTKAVDTAPMTPSLGIAPPNHRYRAGVRVPYVSDESFDYDTEGWRKRSCMLETP
ncbi:hypothetical protein ACHAW6_008764 [Cyclotella cf. meneghiniana]